MFIFIHVYTLVSASVPMNHIGIHFHTSALVLTGRVRKKADIAGTLLQSLLKVLCTMALIKQ